MIFSFNLNQNPMNVLTYNIVTKNSIVHYILLKIEFQIWNRLLIYLFMKQHNVTTHHAQCLCENNFINLILRHLNPYIGKLEILRREIRLSWINCFCLKYIITKESKNFIWLLLYLHIINCYFYRFIFSVLAADKYMLFSCK